MTRGGYFVLLLLVAMLAYAGAGTLARGQRLDRRSMWRLRRAAFSASVTAFGLFLAATGMLTDEHPMAFVGAGIAAFAAVDLWRVRRQMVAARSERQRAQRAR